jgi:hypothetical protein
MDDLVAIVASIKVEEAHEPGQADNDRFVVWRAICHRFGLDRDEIVELAERSGMDSECLAWAIDEMTSGPRPTNRVLYKLQQLVSDLRWARAWRDLWFVSFAMACVMIVATPYFSN